MEGRDIDLKQVMHTMVPPGLHLDYGLDFQTRRVDDIAPTLTSPLLSGLVDNICQLEKPEIPKKPTSFKAEGLELSLTVPNGHYGVALGLHVLMQSLPCGASAGHFLSQM